MRCIVVLCSGLVIAFCCSCEKTTQSTPQINAATPGNAANVSKQNVSKITGKVTFNRDVAPIIFANCSTCHHSGEAAPFTLLTYDDVRRRASQIADVTQKRFMPPWLPIHGKGAFVSERRLSEKDIATIERWVELEMPRGNESDLPATPAFTEGWQTGTPDLVLESPTYTLTSEGRDVFRNFIVPIKLNGTRWIKSIELRPENPRVTHHARLGLDSSGESLRRDAQDDEPGYEGMAWGQDPEGQLVIWAPGMLAKNGTSDVAWRLEPDAYLVLHTHMQPSGKSEKVKFRIGVHFADKAPTQFPAILRIGSCKIDIPADTPRHVVKGEYILPIDVDLHMIFPHAHSLCHDLEVVAMRPDGSREDLISIAHFDENWHESYDYQKPIRLPRGSRLLTTFTYDNTSQNIRNRNRPPRRVVYGSNANDEMADVYIQVTAVQSDQRAALLEDFKQYEFQSQLEGLNIALNAYANDPWILEGIAACNMGLGKPAEAVAVLEKRLQTGPVQVFPMASLGMALAAKKDFTLAETKLRRAIELDERHAMSWLGLGQVLLVQKKNEPALAAFRRALELSPSLLEARLSLADLLFKSNQLDEAKRICKEVANDSPNMAGIWLKLAEISAKQKLYDESLADCNTARRLAPYTHPAKLLLALYCFQNGEAEKTQKLLQEAQTENPNNPMPSLVLGQFARRAHQTEQARKYLAAALQCPIPENWPASHRKRFLVSLHTERLQLAEELQDAQLARDSLADWIKCDPDNRQPRMMLEKLRASTKN